MRSCFKSGAELCPLQRMLKSYPPQEGQLRCDLIGNSPDQQMKFRSRLRLEWAESCTTRVPLRDIWTQSRREMPHLRMKAEIRVTCKPPSPRSHGGPPRAGADLEQSLLTDPRRSWPCGHPPLRLQASRSTELLLVFKPPGLWSSAVAGPGCHTPAGSNALAIVSRNSRGSSSLVNAHVPVALSWQ